MSPKMFLLQMIFLVPVLTKVAAKENATYESIVIQHDVKKVDIMKKVYGGKELKPPPDVLTVTDEVWVDLKISNYYGKGNHFRHRISIACFGKMLPITCQNFVSLIKGYTKEGLYLSYKGTKVQRIIRDFMIQLGDVKSRFSSNKSIYGPKFKDEAFDLSHRNAGWVGMANFGPNTNGSQFYIILRPARWLDGNHVLFGKVIKGMNALRAIGQEETDEEDKPLRTILLENCGIINIKSHYNLVAAQFNTDGDISIDRN